MPPHANVPEPIDLTDQLSEFGIELPLECLPWRVLAHFHVDDDHEPDDDYGADAIAAFERGDWCFYKACLTIVNTSAGRSIGICQVPALEREEIDSGEGLREPVRHFLDTAMHKLGIKSTNVPELPRWPQEPPRPIDLDESRLRLFYGVALPAECDYRVRLTFAHDTVTEPEGLSPAGLAQYQRGEWSYYTATATVTDGRGDFVDSRVARGLRREELYECEATYAAVNDAVFEAIKTWNTCRA